VSVIVDTSALIALIEGEPAYAEQVAAILASDRSPVVAAPTAAETLVVLTARHGPVARTVFDRLRYEIDLLIRPFTEAHAIATQRAYLRYGKGRHPAALNFGDCLTYAAAELAHEPLLAIGNDFPQTDLQFAQGGIVGYWPTPTTG
jgi:ribonuclease VapC